MTDLIELRTLTANLRRHLMLGVLLAMVGVLIGVGVVLTRPTEYRATAEVLATETPGTLIPNVGLTEDSGGDDPRMRTLDTEAQLLRSDEVLDTAAGRIGGIDRTTLMRRTLIGAPAHTRILRITFTAETAERAATGANELARAFVDARVRDLTDRAQRIEDALGERRDQLDGELRALDTATKEVERGSAQWSAVRTERGRLTGQIAGIDRGLAEVAKSAGVRTEVVRQAIPPADPLRGNVEVPPVSGAAAGLLTSLLVGRVRDRRRPLVRSAAQVTAATGLPVFAKLGSREQLRSLATEVRMDGARRVLVTGIGPIALTRTVGTLLTNTLAYGVDAPEVLTSTTSPTGAFTMREAQEVDRILLVAELRRSRLAELAEVAQAVSATGAPTAVVLAPANRMWRKLSAKGSR